MYDILIKLLTTLRGMWRFRWWAAVVMWVIFIIGAVAINLLPDSYESKTRLFIDTKSALKPLLKGLAIETDVQDKIDVMTRAILSRPNIEAMISRTDLGLKVNTPEQMEKLIYDLQQSIIVNNPNKKQKHLYKIGYSHRNPETAQLVVQTLLDLLVEQTLGSNRADTAKAQSFLKEQIEEYETRLTEAEQRLAAFKKDNVGLMPDERGGYYSRLQGELDQLDVKKNQLRLADNKRKELLKQLRGEQEIIGSSELDTKIQERVTELNDLLLRYTDQHPDVIALRETIDQLREQKEAGGTLGSDVSNEDITLNSVYQTIKVSLNETELEISTLKSEISDQEKRVVRLQGLVDTIPEVEANLAKLNRDYNVTKEQYEQLLERLELARISEGAEQNSDEIQFRIIDPPNLPLTPTGPNRILFLLALLGASIGAGVGLTYLLNEIRPVYCSSADLYESTGYPVFGSVGIKWTDAERKEINKDIVRLMSVFSMMILVFLTVLILQFILR